MTHEILHIANPIYDTAFKYLLEDNHAARIFLSVLLGEEVVELEFRPTEQVAEIDKLVLAVFRMDFAARIRSADGSEKLVLIEIQKAKYATDIMRFRKYLGQQYAAESAVSEDPPEVPCPLPILSIYLLGHKLEHIQEPVIRVARQYQDIAGNAINGPREPFIESLTHDSIIVQIPFLSPKRQTELEHLLGLFDQSQINPHDSRTLNIDADAYPMRFQPVIRRLIRAVASPAIRKNMQFEDEIIHNLESLKRTIAAREEDLANMDSALAERDSALAEKDSALAEKDSALAEKDSALAEKDSALAASKAKLEKAIHLLVANGVPEQQAKLMLS